MNDKQIRFVAEYLIDLNATKAAIRAGYSEQTARQQGSDLLSVPDIADAIAAGKAKQLAKAELTAARVLEEMRRLAFSDVRRLFDEAGNLKSVHTLDDDEAAAIASIEIVKKNLAAGDGQTDTVHKLKVWDKSKNLENLAKHFALLTEQVHHTGQLDVVTVLRQRHDRLRPKPSDPAQLSE